MKWIDDLVASLGFVDQSTAPDEAMLGEIESIAGGRLPPECRYFIARYGAGFLGDDDFQIVSPISERCPWGKQVEFATTHALHGRDLVDVQHTYRGRIPKGVIALANDAGGNEICVDVAGAFPGSVWFWDHEQRWFREHFIGSLQDASKDLDESGIDARRFSVHDIIRGWARLHADRFDRPADYMGMYRIAPSFADFLRSLQKGPT